MADDYWYHDDICLSIASALRRPLRLINSTYPNLLPLAAPTASCASPYTRPMANAVFAVLAAVLTGKRSRHYQLSLEMGVRRETHSIN